MGDAAPQARLMRSRLAWSSFDHMALVSVGRLTTITKSPKRAG